MTGYAKSDIVQCESIGKCLFLRKVEHSKIAVLRTIAITSHLAQIIPTHMTYTSCAGFHNSVSIPAFIQGYTSVDRFRVLHCHIWSVHMWETNLTKETFCSVFSVDNSPFNKNLNRVPGTTERAALTDQLSAFLIGAGSWTLATRPGRASSGAFDYRAPAFSCTSTFRHALECDEFSRPAIFLLLDLTHRMRQQQILWIIECGTR